jgi:ketosteroid isomerase-like protein
MAIFSGYGNMIALRSADELVVHKSQDPRVAILEYAVHGTVLRTGLDYNNHFISVITIENRKIAHWRDYMDSYGATAALTGTGS